MWTRAARLPWINFTSRGGAWSLGPTVASAITNCTFSANTQNGAATGQRGDGQSRAGFHRQKGDRDREQCGGGGE